jgi:hypothetical protein
MLDLGEGVGTIIKKVPCLPAVNPDNTQQQLTAQTQGHRRLALANDVLHIILKIRLQNILLCEFPLQVGSKPDACQRPGLRQQRL